MEASRQPGPDDVSTAGDRVALRARLRGISRAFGATQAVLDADLDIRAGEVHALLGENGAGKTTLMRVLAGILRPDAGSIEIDGETVQLRGRRDGARRGIGFVQQHFGLIEEIDGVENYLLGHPRLGSWLHVERARRELRQTAAELELDVDVDCPISDLSVGERQRLESLIALATGADVLILDEPTAALGSAEVEVLERVLRLLTGQGKSVVYITHKLPEVMAFADRVTVMRRGRVVAEFAGEALDAADLTQAMIGQLPERSEVSRLDPGEPVLALEGVGVAASDSGQGLFDIDLEVRTHEVVGIAGISGNGQEALAELLCGLVEPASGEHRHTARNRRLHPRGPVQRRTGADPLGRRQRHRPPASRFFAEAERSACTRPGRRIRCRHHVRGFRAGGVHGVPRVLPLRRQPAEAGGRAGVRAATGLDRRAQPLSRPRHRRGGRRSPTPARGAG